ncbi:MAG: hypothetical protein JKY53_07805 [Flavobacteriales bacterium]|nr:hypothetical protein [Flavobacteriales bacterium]
MNKTYILLSLLSILTISCDTVKKKTKDTINKSGEVVGKTATEFFEGISEGVDRTLQCSIELSQNIVSKGLKTGKFSIESDSIGTNNRLTLYLIFDENFNDSLLVKVFDKKGLEIGRTKMNVAGKKGDANYFDFIFDKRTYIEVKSKVTIE